MNYKILIADDDTELVKMLRTFFELRNYTVITASDGAETLKMVERKPDIILLDINMPKADGIEVCQRIRDKVSCPILFLTARADEQDRVNGLMSGGDDYILKTVQISGQDIELTKLEYSIIEFLSMNPGIVYDKERIYEKVCGYDGDGDSRVITELIRRIRKKIEKYTDTEYIETVWGMGYRWGK